LFKPFKFTLLLLSCLALFMAVMVFTSGTIAGQAAPFSEAAEKLTGLTEKERAAVLTLFTLVRQIEELEREEADIVRETEATAREMLLLESSVAEEAARYDVKQVALRQLLRSYQRMGPSTYLEIILDSNSLADFLRRLSILRDITHNTGRLLDLLAESRNALSAKKAGLAEKHRSMTEMQEQLKETLAQKKQGKIELEVYLASLQEEREYYQEHLAGVQQAWARLLTLFPEVTRAFSRIIAEGNLPREALRTSFTFYGIKGSIDDTTLNQIITAYPGLPNLVFAFKPGEVEIKVPENHLVLTGSFVILEEHTLQFQAIEGSFFGMPLKPGSLEDLFRKHPLSLNLKPLLAGSGIRSVEILNGQLELQIIPVLGGI